MCSTEAEGVSRESCGGSRRGVCTSARICECRAGWTGPHCLVHASFDPVIYERDDGYEDLEFTWPQLKIKGIWMSLTVIAITMMVLPMIKNRMDRWKPLTNTYVE